MIENVDNSSVGSIADYIEWYTIFKNERLSKSKIVSIFTEIEEELIDSIFIELKSRTILYGAISPISVDGNIITPKIEWINAPEITMCLIFSLKGVERVAGSDDGTKLFERLSREAVKKYLGGEAEIIGFPNQSNLKGKITEICGQMKEAIGFREPNPDDKDKGVDLIAWLPHGDGRPNQVALIIQCAAGLNFDAKKPISLTAWTELINWSVEPIRGIVIPKVVEKEEFVELRDDYTLIFDRVRIIRAISKNPDYNTALKEEILSWCRIKLSSESQ